MRSAHEANKILSMFDNEDEHFCFYARRSYKIGLRFGAFSGVPVLGYVHYHPTKFEESLDMDYVSRFYGDIAYENMLTIPCKISLEVTIIIERGCHNILSTQYEIRMEELKREKKRAQEEHDAFINALRENINAANAKNNYNE